MQKLEVSKIRVLRIILLIVVLINNLVSNEMETKICRIFRICYGVLVISLLIPFELIVKKYILTKYAS